MIAVAVLLPQDAMLIVYLPLSTPICAITGARTADADLADATMGRHQRARSGSRANVFE